MWCCPVNAALQLTVKYSRSCALCCCHSKVCSCNKSCCSTKFTIPGVRGALLLEDPAEKRLHLGRAASDADNFNAAVSREVCCLDDGLGDERRQTLQGNRALQQGPIVRAPYFAKANLEFFWRVLARVLTLWGVPCPYLATSRFRHARLEVCSSQ